MSLNSSDRISEMDIDEIRSFSEAESDRVARLGEWPARKLDFAKESIAGRIPKKGQEDAQGFDAGVACSLDMIPRNAQRLSAILHGNYTPEAVAQARHEAQNMDPNAETTWWLAASLLCKEGVINEDKFRHQLSAFENLAADPKARVAAAKKEYDKIMSTFSMERYGFPFGTVDGCIQGAYLAGYPAGGLYSEEMGRYYIGTNFPSLGLENFPWSAELDQRMKPKSGPVHGSRQFVQCANEEEFKRAIIIVKQALPIMDQ